MSAFVTVTDPVRAADWRDLAGTDVLPVVSPLPTAALMPESHGGEPALFYKLDVDVLEEGIADRIALRLAERFGMTPDESRSELAYNGIPILATDCIVAWRSR